MSSAKETPPALAAYHLSICGLEELTDERLRKVTHVLSILDPGMPIPSALRRSTRLDHHHVMRFHDVSSGFAGMRAPSRAHITELLSYGSETVAALGPSDHLLVHCHAGISRSTAAAAILLAQPHPGREAEALARVLDCRPIASPNVRMIAFADKLMQREGRLTAALDGLRHARMEADAEESPSLLRLLARGLRGR